MTISLFQEAAYDVEAEHAGLRMARAKVAVAGLWPFLALARSEREFEHRLALTSEHITGRVDVDLFGPVVASLREDFRAVTAADSDSDGDDDSDSELGDNPDGKPDWLKDKINETSKQGSRQETQIWHEGHKQWIAVQAAEEPTEGNPYYFTGGPEAGPATGMTDQFAPHPTGSDPVDPINQQFPMQPSGWNVPPDAGWNENPMNFAPYKAASGPPPFTHEAKYNHDHANCQDCGGGIHRTNGAGGWWQHDSNSPPSERHPARPNAAYADEARDHYRTHASHKTAEEGVEGRPGPNPNFFGGGGEGATGDPQSGFAVEPSPDPVDERVDFYGTVPPQVSSGSGQRAAMAKLARPVWPTNVRNGSLSMHDHACPECSGVFQCHWPLMGMACQADQSFDHRHFHGGFADGEHKELPKATPEHFASLRANMHRTAAGTPSPEPPQQVFQDDQVDSGPLMGTHLTEHERDRWEQAQDKAPVGYNMAPPSAHQGARFYDPTDPSVRMVAAAPDPFSGGNNPYNQQQGGAGAPAPPPAMTPNGPGATAMPPMTPATTKPRQIPGGGQMPGGGTAPAPGGGPQANAPQPGQQPKPITSARHIGDGMNKYRPTSENPFGTADAFDTETWDAATKQRPMMGRGDMHINGPQNPMAREPIRTVQSPHQQPGGANEEEDDEEENEPGRREAAQSFTQAVANIRGAALA